jgi:3-oxoacyl-[acyl-carrier-protein] synthase II
VLETLEAAAARGARPLGELAGAGASCDAHHMTAPDPDGGGAALALRRALEDAGLSAAAVDTINAHGTGTPLNDAAEYRALVAVFGERTGAIPLTATKGSIGHLLGSAGAIEAVATVLSLERQRVPPTPGGGAIDPELAVRLVRDRPLDARLEVAVSINLAFGGCNGALVFCRWNPA